MPTGSQSKSPAPAFAHIALTAAERAALVTAYVAGRAAGAVSVHGKLAAWAHETSGRDLEPLALMLKGVADGRLGTAAASIAKLRFRDPAARGQAEALAATLDMLNRHTAEKRRM